MKKPICTVSFNPKDLSIQIAKMMGNGSKPNRIVMNPLTSLLLEKSPFLTRGHIIV